MPKRHSFFTLRRYGKYDVSTLFSSVPKLTYCEWPFILNWKTYQLHFGPSAIFLASDGGQVKKLSCQWNWTAYVMISVDGDSLGITLMMHTMLWNHSSLIGLVWSNTAVMYFSSIQGSGWAVDSSQVSAWGILSSWTSGLCVRIHGRLPYEERQRGQPLSPT